MSLDIFTISITFFYQVDAVLLETEQNMYPAIHLNTFHDSSARQTRVKRVCEGLKSSLRSRIELIESYAKVCIPNQIIEKIGYQYMSIITYQLIHIETKNNQISSMIEIEVEMDTDVLAAEAASNAVRIV